MNIRYADNKCFTQLQVQDLFRSVDWISADYPQRLIKALNQCETVFTAWDDEKLVGLINAIDDGELTAYVHYLCVRPEYQKQGIGKELLSLIKDKYKDYLYLILIAENRSVVNFYEKCDFQKADGTSVMEIINQERGFYEA